MPSRFRIDMVDGLNSLNMMLPGASVTYQGEEIGMRDGYVSWNDTVDVEALQQGNESNYMEFSRDPARTPFHWDNSTNAGFSTGNRTWLPIAQDYMELNLAKQKEDDRSHYKVYIYINNQLHLVNSNFLRKSVKKKPFHLRTFTPQLHLRVCRPSQ